MKINTKVLLKQYYWPCYAFKNSPQLNKTWLGVFLLIFLSFSGFAADYYVAKTGNDANPGTQNLPFLTISKAASVARAGDRVIIYAGTYYETVRPANSGTAGNPIRFTAAAGNKVIISAMQTINNWTQHQGAIYKARMDWDLGQDNMIMHNEVVCDLARWPNNTDGNPFTLNSFRNTGGSGTTRIQDAFLDYAQGIPDFDWKNGGSILFYGDAPGKGWTTWRRFIKYQNGNRIYFDLDGTDWIRNHHPPQWLGEFFLEGAFKALDYQNEWYYDKTSKTLYLQLPSGQAPAPNTVRAKRREFAIDLRNRHHITFENLAVFGATIEISGNASNNKLYRVSSFYGNHSRGITGSFIKEIQSVHLGGKNNIVEQCEIAWGAGSGVRDRGEDNKIVNNLIHDFGYLGDYNAPVLLRGGKNAYLRQNTIYNAGRDCIQWAGKPGGEIAYNDVSRSNLVADDCALIYTCCGNYYGKIHHNWFHDAQGRGTKYKAAGVYLDNDTKHMEVYKNVIWNLSWTAVQINWNGTDLDIFNNTMWDVKQVMGAWRRKKGEAGAKKDDVLTDARVWNNLSNDGNWDPDSDRRNNLTTTAFSFYSTTDYRLLSGTQPIDKGRVIAGVTDGYRGSAPDVGAYELGENWKAGIDWNPKRVCYGLPGEGCSQSGSNQQLISNGVYYIGSVYNTQNLVARSSENHNARMVAPGPWGAQQWYITHLGDNVYTIRNQDSKRYLEVPYGKCTSSQGSNVATWTDANDAHKRWKIEKIPEGYMLKPMHCRQQALDRDFGKIDANVHIYDALASNGNQHWRIVSVSNTRQTSQIEQEVEKAPVLIYPNPNQGQLFIKGAKAGDQMVIYNKLGQPVATAKLTGAQNVLDIHRLKAGYYVISINGETNLKLIKK